MSRFTPQLTGAHVLVTGGSKGIGRVIVETFLAEGANVSYGARTVRGDEFSLFKDAADGARAVGSVLDIGDPASIKSWVENAAKEFGRIDIVVAMVSSSSSQLETISKSSIASPLFTEASPEAWTKSFQADILGLWTLIDATTPHLEARSGTGSIVVISSVAGFEAKHPSARGPYTTFKRAQATMAKDHARVLGPKGIRINTVTPGGIETPTIVHPDGTEELSSFGKMKRDKPEFMDILKSQVPLGDVGEPQDIANAVVYLGSRLAKYVTGANIFVDGALSTFL
ncbi:hypothetical protein G7Z17_g2662 [Cylindrodendrum hubeiense]|uniref:NAD(P)-binding protein n=1 Tax=Cylindrodendrum hubeiense TaxID=595255 RepID=A0A9P5HJB4_9HYPO|nr:hypothetical protein G7Z17_g2662 [Cylindrodendrum hubeiense]